MLPLVAIDPIIQRALEEDLGSGDLTSDSCVDPDSMANAAALACHPLVACGAVVFRRTFELVDASLVVETVTPDGDRAEAGDILWRVRGRTRSVLAAERVALNFVQRMCGIATLTRRYLDAVPAGAATRITDTRKTTPGLRLLERYAVRTAGAHNHRYDLGSAVLIKDNHLVAAGGVALAVARARARAPHTSRIEVEVGSLGELDEALAAGADVVLLDNMDTPTIVEAVACARRRVPPPVIEASGGICLERVGELCRAGVDVISVGALTHSAPAADISLELALGDGA